MKHTDRLRESLEKSILAKKEFLANYEQVDIFGRAIEAVVEGYRQGGRLYIAGNGGSAADAQHLAAEFVSKLAKPRAPLPAEALTVDSSILTAIGNDYGYDEVFARQIAGKMRVNDLFLGITTSGRSPNILRALEQCRSMKMTTIVFCGRDGGDAKKLSDFCIIASGEETSTIQELHIVLAHTLCAAVEAEMFPDVV
ncbi:MAG: SIS domain-containing protein [Nitrospirae bacterium]|nr:SIS domain-containing protein [Candidatus Manganitrophaceae bacterium]